MNEAILEQSSCLAWVYLNKIRGENNVELEFRKHSFLIDVYNDWNPIQVVRKSSQVGFSTAEILKSFWGMKYKGFNIIYTLPTFGDVGQFVPSKVNAIIQSNSILQKWTKDKDTILQKKVGDNFIYYRGTQSKKSEKEKSESGVGIMFSADLLVMDEADRSDQFILEQYESRLEASDYKGKWYFSNPSHPNTISQKLWEKSDQKHWFVKCSHCNEWQYLSYPESIRDGKFVCKKCGREIRDEDRIAGEWIKKYKNREISGYWISQLIAPWHNAKDIQEKAETKTKEYFYNFILGLPYRGSDIVVDRDLILRAIDERGINTLKGVVMGVDVGIVKHFVVGNSQGIFLIGKTKDWGDIEFLMKKYDIEAVVIDALPDITEPRKIQQKYPGKVWLSFFKKEIQKSEFIKWDLSSHSVYSDRGKIIGLVIDEFADRKIRLQINKDSFLEEYIKHWETAYKAKEIDNLGIEHSYWDTKGENHFIMATVYWRLALELVGKGKTKLIDNLPGMFEGEVPQKAPDLKEIAKLQEEQEKIDWRT